MTTFIFGSMVWTVLVVGEVCSRVRKRLMPTPPARKIEAPKRHVRSYDDVWLGLPTEHEWEDELKELLSEH